MQNFNIDMKSRSPIESSFSQTHKVDNIGIIINFVLTDVRKCEIRNHEVYKDHTSKLNLLFDKFIFIGRAKELKQSWQYCHSCIGCVCEKV